jgi:hypothetical protein
LKCEGDVQDAYDQRFSGFPNCGMTLGAAFVKLS